MFLRGLMIAQCWVNVRTHASGAAWSGDKRASLCAWQGSERSPKDGRTFASSVCLAQLRMFRRTIAQGWANIRFLSVFSTIEEVLANNRPRMGERSLPQYV
jgi:hypothetical protein